MADNEGETGAPRTLAAIVFTDAVGFSKLAERDEALAHRLLKRDFALMERITSSNRGRIANTMGDGALLVFPSAVDAMKSALEIQKELHDVSKSLPPGETLLHRMGVHMGDIVIDGSNVFGDGVNVAARLENEAKPGTICYSRQVADLVRGKLAFPAQYLGPRALKNIEERVSVWSVPALGDKAPSVLPEMPTSAAPISEGVTGGKGIALVTVSVGMVALAAFFVLAIPRGSKLSAPPPTTPPVLRQTPDSSSTTRSATTPPPVAPVAPIAVQPSTSGTELDAKEDAYRREYDFSSLVLALKARYPQPTEMEAAMIRRYEGLAGMRTWMEGALPTSGEVELVKVTTDVGAGQALYEVYVTDGILQFASGTGAVARPFRELSPRAVLDVANVLATQSDAPPTARTWLSLFGSEYGV